MKTVLAVMALLFSSSAFADTCDQYQVLRKADTAGNSVVKMTDINSVSFNTQGNMIIRFDSITVSPSFTSKCKFLEVDTNAIKKDGRFKDNGITKLVDLITLAAATGANLGFSLDTDQKQGVHYIGFLTMVDQFTISPKGKSTERRPMID